jgi:hypothetical protein
MDAIVMVISMLKADEAVVVNEHNEHKQQTLMVVDNDAFDFVWQSKQRKEKKEEAEKGTTQQHLNAAQDFKETCTLNDSTSRQHQLRYYRIL